LTRPQKILRAVAACAVPSALAAGAILGADVPDSHAAPAHAGASGSGAAGTGDVAIARRRLNVESGRRALVSGHVAPAAAGRAVALERRSRRGWRTIDHVRTTSAGTFAFRFRPREPGSALVRVRAGAHRARVGRLNVYRRAQVSWYGPGLYGGHLGCGGTLTPGTLGVANKTLPCGTKVTLRHGGRTVRVPVVDRGPYVGGREYDLTAATRAKLGFAGVGMLLVAD
jgi:rare lipoprotein A